MEKKAGLVSKQTAAGFSASCYLIHDFLFLWKKKSLPGQMFLSQHFPWRRQSVLFVILYRSMENFIEINLPYCPRSTLFAVQITVFLSLKCFLNSVWRRCCKHETSSSSANVELN